MDRVSGYRTYISAAALVAVAALGLSGGISPDMVNQVGMVAVAAVATFLRAAIAKQDKRLQPVLNRVLDAALAELAKAPVATVKANSIEDELPDYRRIPSRKSTIIPPLVMLSSICVPSLLAAAPPRAIVTGPTTATPGEFLVLDASQSERDPTHFRWMIAPELKGRKQLVPSEDGRRCTVATYPGIYLVTLAVSNADGADIATWQVAIPGQAPCPPPEPQPVKPVNPSAPIVPDPKPDQPKPPQPTPPGPVSPVGPDTMGVRSSIVSAARAIADPVGAATLADRASSLASKIRAGGESSVQSVVNTIAKEVQQAGPKWAALLTVLKAAIQGLLASGKLSPTNIETWAVLLDEIAAALREAVK